MRFLIVLAFLLFSPTSLGEEVASDVTVLHINTKWNKRQNINLKTLRDCDVKFVWLEEQGIKLKEQIQTVPTIVVLKQNKVVRQWAADLSFRLDVDLNEIQQVIDKL